MPDEICVVAELTNESASFSLMLYRPVHDVRHMPESNQSIFKAIATAFSVVRSGC